MSILQIFNCTGTIMIRGHSSSDIIRSIEREIELGKISPGEHLPSVRELAKQLRVSPGTVALAYKSLRERGILHVQQGRKAIVAYKSVLSASDPSLRISPDLRDLASGNPDSALLPELNKIIRSLSFSHHLYGQEDSNAELVAIGSKQFAQDGVMGDVFILGGAMDALERILGQHIRFGDKVAVEDPGYASSTDIQRAMGAQPVGIPIDEYGMIPEHLEQALHSGISTVVITPRGQNPMGSAFDAERASHLRKILNKFPDVMIIENDHAAAVAGTDYYTLVAGRARWAVVRSLSKSLGPDFRLAFVSADPWTARRVQGRRSLGPGWTSHILQKIACACLTDPEVGAQVAHASREYNHRRTSLMSALAERGICVRARSGLNIGILVPSEEIAMRGLIAAGWLVRAGKSYSINSKPFIRITTALLRPGEPAGIASALSRILGPETGMSPVR
jgi:DNA-binding transcriptional MocR family regulator